MSMDTEEAPGWRESIRHRVRDFREGVGGKYVRGARFWSGPLDSPFGPFGPFGPFRRRGSWKYMVAATLARAAADQAARRIVRGRRRKRREPEAAESWWKVRTPNLSGWRGLRRPRPEASNGTEPAAQLHANHRIEEDSGMPRFGRGFPGFDEPGFRSGRGDVKYVLLDLVREGPRHGYDMIKEIERRSGGMYTPSP